MSMRHLYLCSLSLDQLLVEGSALFMGLSCLLLYGSCEKLQHREQFQASRPAWLSTSSRSHFSSTTMILRSSCCAYLAMAMVSSYSRSDFCRKASMVCCSQFIWFLNSSSFILAFMISFWRGVRVKRLHPRGFSPFFEMACSLPFTLSNSDLTLFLQVPVHITELLHVRCEQDAFIEQWNSMNNFNDAALHCPVFYSTGIGKLHLLSTHRSLKSFVALRNDILESTQLF